MKFQVFALWNFKFSHCDFQVLTLWNFRFPHCEISSSHTVKFQVFTLWNFEFSNCEISISHIVNFKFSHCEISSSHIMKFQVLTLWNFKFSHCEISNSHIAKFHVLSVVTMMNTVFWDVIVYYVVWEICTNFWTKHLHPSEYFKISGGRFIWGVDVVVTRLLACWHCGEEISW